ncbi:MAG: acetyl-CoA carboxylase biotin carboxyl carrier protein [Pseudomonadota bacterium]
MSKKSHDSDVAFIRALAELLTENGLSELEVKRDYGEDDSLQVRVSRMAAVPAPAVVSVPQVPALQAPAAAEAEVPQVPSTSPASGDPAAHPGAVTSPMVGTAYLQPEPGSEPFVRIGSEVSEGQTLMIVEAMKTMNQIPSPRAGTVKRILVGDGDPVEYGAPLMIIE